MDVKSLNGTSGRWSDISLAVPFDTDMDRQIRDKLMDAVEEELKGNANCGYDPFGAERFGIKRHIRTVRHHNRQLHKVLTIVEAATSYLIERRTAVSSRG